MMGSMENSGKKPIKIFFCSVCKKRNTSIGKGIL